MAHHFDAVNSSSMASSSGKLLLISIVGLTSIVVCWALFRRAKHPQPIADHPRLAEGVAMRDVVFFSHALQREMPYRVFLPQAAGNQKLPVVYLLHGGCCGFRDWSNFSDVARFASQGLVLVMPEGGYSYYTNSAQKPQDRFEDYIVIDLPADVERRFPVRNDRGGRAIVGVSMGGFGAVKLALRHPEQFVFAGALSPAIDAPRRRFSWRPLDQSHHFQEIFGADDTPTRHDNDPFFLVRGAEAGKTPYLYVTCGQQEGLLAPVREFSVLLDRYHIAHEFHIAPGGHDWNHWNRELPGVFGSLTSHLDVGVLSH
jgi:S-formylglutathione hydrolase FrmB